MQTISFRAACLEKLSNLVCLTIPFIIFASTTAVAATERSTAKGEIRPAPGPALPAAEIKGSVQNPTVAQPELADGVPAEALVREGARLALFDKDLKSVFPEATRIRELDFLPATNGGSSFTGLVTRLLGVGLDRHYEGMKTRRYYYLAYGAPSNTLIGAVHGSSYAFGNSDIHIFAYYTGGGTVKRVRVEGLPESVSQELENGAFLKQFEGRSTEDFEVILGKKGRVKSKGDIFKIIRFPSSTLARNHFDKIFRSLRYNAAFMDVAFFITQHPDLADRKTNEFPEQISVTTGSPVSGPEAFVSNKGLGSPIDGKPLSHHEVKSQGDSKKERNN